MPRGGHHCCVVGCKSNSSYSVPKRRFFRIPSTTTRPELRQKWVNLIKRAPPFKVTNNTRICDLHFVENKPTFVNPLPVLNMGYTIETPKPRRLLFRHEYIPKKRKRVEQPIAEDISDDCTGENVQAQEDTALSDISEEAVHEIQHDTDSLGIDHSYYILPDHPNVNTPLSPTDDQYDKSSSTCDIQNESGDLPALVKKMKSEIKALTNQVLKLQNINKTRPKFSLADIMNSDKKIHLYTGFTSYKCLHVIFEKLVKKRASKLSMSTRSWRAKLPWYKRGRSTGRKPGGQRKLSLENEFLLVLMKIKLDLLDEDLADRFGISPTTVSLLINRWIPVVAACLKKLILWPSKDLVRSHLPAKFKGPYARTRVIVDCAEIFIEKPSNILARQQTYSNYKHHNTAKFLVGISPTGGVTTLSKAWGGRASDKHIVQNSEAEFLDKLDVGDQVMADRGFDISDILARRCCTLVIPPFTRGKTQLSQYEVEQGRQISILRIHVERAIERIKRFRILQGVFPLKRIGLLNDILTVCAALTNLLPPLVVDQPNQERVNEISGLNV